MTDGALPSDWASIADDGTVRPSGPPDDQEASPRYGYDAPRALLRLAEACDETSFDLAAASLTAARTEADGANHPVWLVGAAAAAHAAGEEDERDTLLDEATAMAKRSPTYYGWALVALGRTMLTSDALGRCPA
jgi:endoglucanase